MTKAIYKVGDILEIECQYGMFSSDKKSRCLVLKCIKPGYEFIIYTLLVLKSDDSFTVIGVNQKDIILTAKRIGHIDISLLRFEEKEQEEPDYEKMMTVCAFIEAGNLRKLLEEETLKRKQAETECKEKAKENERLSYENSDLKALNDELRKSIPEYNRLALEHFACTEKIKKLEAENEPLKRENEELRATNKKLAEANARYLQSMTCAKKQMTEAAKRICEAEEHIDVAVCNN